jgi:hypothetical protein
MEPCGVAIVSAKTDEANDVPKKLQGVYVYGSG